MKSLVIKKDVSIFFFQNLNLIINIYNFTMFSCSGEPSFGDYCEKGTTAKCMFGFV